MKSGARARVVSLLTDFGTADHYVGVVKAVVLAKTPEVTLVDLSHEIAPGAVEQAAFTLLASYLYFPRGSVHIAVVDPGVGSKRRALIVSCGEQLFVGPDNGIFSYLLDRESSAQVYHVNQERFSASLSSNTFHGRDLFAPVGAAVAAGTPPAALGEPIDDPIRLTPLPPVPEVDGTLSGRVLHVDRFGNCVTNLTVGDLPPDVPPFALQMGGTRIRELRSHYADAPGDEPFLIWGSSGFLEISINSGSAARRLGIEAGDSLRLVLVS